MFQRAKKKNLRLKIALCGEWNTGKTYSSLLIATSITTPEKVAVIDTEGGRSVMYADVFGEYAVAEMRPPFSPLKYIELMDMAEREGFEVVVIDNLSFAHSGEGGFRDLHRTIASESKKDSFRAWGDVKDRFQDPLFNKILNYPLHLIAALRVREVKEFVQTGSGKKELKVTGVVPDMRKGFEYCFPAIVVLGRDHKVQTIIRDNLRIFQKGETITRETISRWTEAQRKGEGPLDFPRLKSLVNQFLALPEARGLRNMYISYVTEKYNLSGDISVENYKEQMLILSKAGRDKKYREKFYSFLKESHEQRDAANGQ